MTTRTKKAATTAEVLEQLQIAHAVIQNALQLMTSDQKREWSRKNTEAGMDPEDGITGYHARKDVIERATRGAS